MAGECFRLAQQSAQINPFSPGGSVAASHLWIGQRAPAGVVSVTHARADKSPKGLHHRCLGSSRQRDIGEGG